MGVKCAAARHKFLAFPMSWKTRHMLTTNVCSVGGRLVGLPEWCNPRRAPLILRTNPISVTTAHHHHHYNHHDHRHLHHKHFPIVTLTTPQKKCSNATNRSNQWGGVTSSSHTHRHHGHHQGNHDHQHHDLDQHQHHFIILRPSNGVAVPKRNPISERLLQVLSLLCVLSCHKHQRGGKR